MPRQNSHLKTSLRRLLFGERWSITKWTLLLSIGFFSVVGVANVISLSVRHPSGEFSLQRFWWDMMNYAFGFTTFSPSVDPVGAGVFLIIGLALIHAYLNQGYIPSFVLATAPIYANFVFTVDGPVGLIIPIHENLVVAPFWAASHVFPNSFIYGTLGFVLGLGLRHFHRRYTAGSDQEVVRTV